MITQDLIFPKAAAPSESKGAYSIAGAPEEGAFESAMDRALSRNSARKTVNPEEVEQQPLEKVVQLPGQAIKQTPGRRNGPETSELEESASREGSEKIADESADKDNETPANIVLFPNPAVVIPFPIALACGRADASSLSGSGEAGQIIVLPGMSEGASSTAAQTSSGIVPLVAAAPSIDKSAPSAEASSKDGDGKGIDVSKLGMTRVDEPSPVLVQDSPAEERQASVVPEEVIPLQGHPTGAGSAKPLLVSETPAQPAQKPSHPRGETPAGGELIQLPGAEPMPEDSAREAGENTPLEQPVTRGKEVKTSTNVVIPQGMPALEGAAKTAGIPSAKHENGMSFSEHSQQGEALDERTSGALKESAGAMSYESGNGSDLDFSARSSGATEWQVSRPVDSSDRSAADPDALPAVDHIETVDRISRLVVREAALVRQYHSDSMAVVLRPDAETELFVHLSQRNGQIEAVVRCERGDAQTLGALWPQLQESLASQKVRLAPLQESPTNNSNFNSSAGAGSNGQGNGNGFSRQTPGRQSMDEWPAPASSDSGLSQARTRGESRHRRVTTSRPGWETWA